MNIYIYIYVIEEGNGRERSKRRTCMDYPVCTPQSMGMVDFISCVHSLKMSTRCVLMLTIKSAEGYDDVCIFVCMHVHKVSWTDSNN